MRPPINTLTIQEMSHRVNVSKHTLRFWEKELNGVIVPLRTKGAQRRYTLEHVLVVEEIKRLKDEGYSLNDIRYHLNRRLTTKEDESSQRKTDDLANKIAEIVRTAVSSFLLEKTVKE